MGVLNITPNSFSDGDENLSLLDVENKLNKLISWANIIDIGAESTAPFNRAIDSSVELKRFDQLLIPVLEKMSDPETVVSIDTYKIDVFDFVARKIKDYWPKSDLVFNDVSGKIDDVLMNYLTSSELDFSYVFCHNLCPTRDESSNHMNHCEDSLSIEMVKDFFSTGLNKLTKSKRKIILDPCFGFSKTREQNHMLIKKMPFLLDHFLEHDFIFGVSKKSFMRFPKDLDINTDIGRSIVQSTEAILLYKLKAYSKRLIIRTHSCESLMAIESSCKILND